MSGPAGIVPAMTLTIALGPFAYTRVDVVRDGIVNTSEYPERAWLHANGDCVEPELEQALDEIARLRDEAAARVGRTEAVWPKPTAPACNILVSNGKCGALAVENLGGSTNAMGVSSFFDGEGRSHLHDPNRWSSSYRCAAGHIFTLSEIRPCWCGWPKGTPLGTPSYREGQEARGRGKRLTDNPYVADTFESDAWRAGFVGSPVPSETVCECGHRHGADVEKRPVT